MIEQLTAALAIDAKDVIGEAPTWDAKQSRLLWSDNKSGVLHEARSHCGAFRETMVWHLGQRIGAAIPRVSGGFVVASGASIYGLDEAGALTPFATLGADPAHFQLNDAKCDRQGRLWTGTLDADVNRPGRQITPGRGALYRIDPDGAVTTILRGITVSNGLDWSPDGSVFYYIDSYTRQVDAYDFDTRAGTIKNRRVVVRFPSGDGAPDGMTVDSEGCLWVTMAGASEVRRYSPQGLQLVRVSVPTPTPTSCAFGGEDNAQLFITSARVRLPQAAFTTLTHGFSVEVEDALTEPGAGGLYSCQPGVAGIPGTPFAG